MLKPMFWKTAIFALFSLNLGLVSEAAAFCGSEGNRTDDCAVLHQEAQVEPAPESTPEATSAARMLDSSSGFDAGSMATEYYSPGSCYTVTRCGPRGCRKVRVCN